MKKFQPYIITFGILALIAMVIIGANQRLPRKMDERITLREKDKIPYGTAAATNLIGSLFIHASVFINNKSPEYWTAISSRPGNHAVILICGYFNAGDDELRQILNFAAKGNYIYIIARDFSTAAQTTFNFSYGQDNFSALFDADSDSLRLRLGKPFFSSDSMYIYPGKKFESWFETIDTTHTAVLGRNESLPNFIRMNVGDGAVFIHTAPLAFSNYFILHKNNIRYFEQALSVIPQNVTTVVWNEYYLNKKNRNRQKNPNWLNVLFRYPPFKWGFLTALSGLLLFVLLNSRRRQRMIPAHPKPKNESLDFVKTMGRLYYERRDHKNLAKKMSVYFLEHVRSTYKLPTHTLDDLFVDTLHYKSGYSKEGLNAIVSFIQQLQKNNGINEYHLINFHNQLESFYQNT